MVRCNDLLAVGSGALDMLSCMPSLRRVYLNGLPTMVDMEVCADMLTIMNRCPHRLAARALVRAWVVVGTEVLQLPQLFSARVVDPHTAIVTTAMVASTAAMATEMVVVGTDNV